MDTYMIAMEMEIQRGPSSMLAIATLVHITRMRSSEWLLTLQSISKTDFRKPSQSRGPCKISPLLPVILISLHQLHQASGGGTAGNLFFCPQESRAQYSWYVWEVLLAICSSAHRKAELNIAGGRSEKNKSTSCLYLP